MKRRHPMQVMDAAKLVVGDVYVVVICYKDDDDLHLYEERCLAVVANTEQLLMNRGRWRGPAHGCNEYELDDLLDAKPAFIDTMDLQPAMKKSITPFTVHLDGWVPDEPPSQSAPMIVDWTNLNGTISCECVWEFSHDGTCSHTIIVPVAAWLSDPRIHVLDWVNPDDVVVPLGTILGSEKAARKKTDDNLRRIFG